MSVPLMLPRSHSWPLCSTCNLSLCFRCSLHASNTSSENRSSMSQAHPRILLYILRRDIRLSDNPIFHHVSHRANQTNSEKSPPNPDRRVRDDSLTSEHGDAHFTHFLPVYVFPANQIEVSGFLSSSADRCPYPEARSQIAGVWRTGPHRAKFIAEGVWDLKRKLESLECGSGLETRVGRVGDVVSHILDWYSKDGDKADNKAKVTGIYMTDDDGIEEKDDVGIVRKIAGQHNVDFKVWADEKYYIDECVIPTFASPWGWFVKARFC